MYPIIVCEDDAAQLEQLHTLIKNYILFHSDLFKIELTANNPNDVLTYLEKEEPQITLNNMQHKGFSKPLFYIILYFYV